MNYIIYRNRFASGLYAAGWLHDFNLSLWVDPLRFGNLLTTEEALEVVRERNSMPFHEQVEFEGGFIKREIVSVTY